MATINGEKVNNSMLPDIGRFLQAGINPKNGLPIKMTDKTTEQIDYKSSIKHALRIVDEQTALNRYKWYNLPGDIDGHLVERILYYKGQGMLFFMKTINQFFFLPYALDGEIDVYGRFVGVTPLPFNGVTYFENGKTKTKPWITGLIRKPIYKVLLEGENQDIDNYCVLLSDYSKQINQMNVPRQVINENVLDAMAEAIPLARTNLIANCGVEGMRVPDTDSASNVQSANDAIYRASLNGKTKVPIVGAIEFQELSAASALKTEEYLAYMQALDNFRLSLYGLDAGGVYQKKAHMLQSESDGNASNSKLIYEDGLTLRQNFCDIVNSIWGLGIWCEEAEAVQEQEQEQEQENVSRETSEGGDDDVDE